jgi:hypothetical protein
VQRRPSVAIGIQLSGNLRNAVLVQQRAGTLRYFIQKKNTWSKSTYTHWPLIPPISDFGSPIQKVVHPNLTKVMVDDEPEEVKK